MERGSGLSSSVFPKQLRKITLHFSNLSIFDPSLSLFPPLCIISIYFIMVCCDLLTYMLLWWYKISRFLSLLKSKTCSVHHFHFSESNLFARCKHWSRSTSDLFILCLQIYTYYKIFKKFVKHFGTFWLDFVQTFVQCWISVA